MSNLPPGVTESMIPGNRPEDVEDEAFLETLYERLAEKHTPGPLGQFTDDEDVEALLNDVALIAREIGWERGYDAGKVDAGLEAYMKESAEEPE